MNSQKSITPIDKTFLETEIFPFINKPARYLGIEHGAYRKNPFEADVLMAMIFPDLYEIGVSNYGHKLLYSHVNNQPGYLCDRAYAPAKDMMAKLKEKNTLLYGIESLVPLTQMDMLAFTLQYELNYTSILGVLDSAGIPYRTADRSDWSTPILIAGGPGSGNPFPLGPFFDAIIIGDGEEVLLEILELLKTAKNSGWDKLNTRQKLAGIEGVFVPGISQTVRKRIVDITQQNIELAPLIPYIQTVHDRVTIEARRGCDRMCRFCQPCFINLPVREQKIDTIRKQALEEIEKTGYEECSLLSLSIADYSQLKPLIHEVADALNEKGVSLSLPSQRADRFDLEVAEAVQQVRKSTLTFAPEAGSERLRRVLNKNLTEKEILDAVTSSFKAGWNKVKLYFIIGNPTETDEDLLAIRDLVIKMKEACEAIPREANKSKKNFLDVNVTLSNFVPKPHTPFQWVAQDTMAELARKREFLKDAFRGMRGIKLNFTDPEISKLEAVISRGDARLANVIERAYNKGAYLDAWDEHMTFPEWFESLAEEGIDADHYAAKTFTRLEEPLPWDIIDMGLEKSWLQEEFRKSLEEASSDPCFVGCSTCGVCTEFNVMPVFTKSSEMIDFKPTLEKTTSREDLFPPPTVKVRLMIQKTGDMRFISHLDWLRMLHRAIFRAQIPVAYSQGFNPSPKVSFGPALPLFEEGFEEYIDMDLVRKVDDIGSRLNDELPPEGQILQVTWLPLETSSLDKSLRYLVYSAQRTCDFAGTGYTLKERFAGLLDQPQWVVNLEKKQTRDSLDIKPFIQDIQLVSDDIVQFKIIIDRSQRQVKPLWFLEQLDPEAQWRVQRLKVGLAHAENAPPSFNKPAQCEPVVNV